MLRIGEKQELIIARQVSFGVYLTDEEKQESVLLPKKEVPSDARVGDALTVFLYLDSGDRPIASTKEPVLTLGKTAVLTVKDVTKIGAFLDWGMDKDLLLPFKEQTRKVRPGESCLVALYLDKSSRLCATMNVYPYLHKNAPYQAGDQVRGRIYETSSNFGLFVAVDDRYSALIPRKEASFARGLQIGDVITARVTGVKEDGKLDLSVRDKAYLEIDSDADKILSVIEEYAGVLPFGEKVSPEVIAREFGMSKAAFKRAIGRLLKEGRITLSENRIYLRT